MMVVAGSQQALDITARVLLDPGDAAWIEEPCYPLVRALLLGSGCRTVPVPVDTEGLDVDAGIQLGPEARVAFVTPSHHYALGVTMSASRRFQLLEWARQLVLLDRGGRLRQRIPLREHADSVSAGPRPRRARDLHRHLQQGPSSVSAAWLHRHSSGSGGAFCRGPFCHGHLPALPLSGGADGLYAGRPFRAPHPAHARALQVAAHGAGGMPAAASSATCCRSMARKRACTSP